MWCSPGKVQSHTAAYFPFALTSFSLQSSSIQVANLACSISNNEEGVKLVRMAATQIDSLCPQVSLIQFVSKADILDLMHSSLHVTHSLSCPFSSPWKVLPINHGPFQVLPFSKRTANCSSLSKITVVIISFPSVLTFSICLELLSQHSISIHFVSLIRLYACTWRTRVIFLPHLC